MKADSTYKVLKVIKFMETDSTMAVPGLGVGGGGCYLMVTVLQICMKFCRSASQPCGCP